MSEPLTLAEAVPLGTVYLQRLLAAAGIRSLAIKGPAFVELGVRKPRQSNDIDLLIHPEDRRKAHDRLRMAGWSNVSAWLPKQLDDVIHSTTWRHPTFPATADLHHGFAGLLCGSSGFEIIWETRSVVSVAHSDVVTASAEQALVIEALNRFKAHSSKSWAHVANGVASAAMPFDVSAVEEATIALGAEHTAAPLIEALGGQAPSTAPRRGYDVWIKDAGRSSRGVIWRRLMARSPWHAPRVLFGTLLPGEGPARHWSDLHARPYRGRLATLGERVKVQLETRPRGPQP